MKRILLILTFSSFLSATFAQDLTSKKGENYLPEQDEWAIGLSATSFLNYAGNLFNSVAVAPSAAEPMITQTFYGKMFTDDDQAYRVTLGLNMGSITDNTEVPGLESDGTTTGSNVTNTEKMSSSMIALGFGKEFRRGSTRLQGVYGAEGIVMLGSGSTKYTYGNSIKASAMGGEASSRPIEEKEGGTFGLAIRGFVGAEYFIAPKISISAEYGWGIGLTSTGGGSTSTETYDFVEDSTDNNTSSGPSDSSFSLANDMGLASGTLGLILHF